ncbi:hypothetical protein HIM_10396 [Hirsutella minnesotensis 3608]|uniref:Prion-inhibition and propagation HeLo domain-containing protein n=1 Tax=Hirsutella minnesotensis 3608 TaxID=1043627 RepID=A0A0F7ZK51_9HYPO|nr:hypothetical protein HIM_10396 [Hirsutella minnesotensis 3608]
MSSQHLVSTLGELIKVTCDGFQYVSRFITAIEKMGHDLTELRLSFREELTKTSIFAQAYNLLIDENTPRPVVMPSLWTITVIERFAMMKMHLERAEELVDRYTGNSVPAGFPDLSKRARAAAFDLGKRPTASLAVIDEANEIRKRMHTLQKETELRLKLEWSMKHKSSLEEAVKHLKDDNAALLGLTMQSMLNTMYDAVLSHLPLKDMLARPRAMLGPRDVMLDAEAQAYELRKDEQTQAQIFIDSLDIETIEQKKARMLEISRFPALLVTEFPDDRTRTATYYEGSPAKEHVLVEWKEYAPRRSGQSDLTEDQVICRVSDVVAILNSPPTFLRNVLPSVGFFRDHRRNCRGSSWIGIAYRTFAVSYTDHCKSLRDLLTPQRHGNSKELCPQWKPPLGERFRLAQTLAESLLQIHNCGWLHKGLRPENIVFFAHNSSIANPYLLGWEYARSAREGQVTEAVNAWVEDAKLYRHPDWFKEPEASTSKYRIEFDQYQLGCVLLEIGRWGLIGNQGLRGATRTKFSDDENGRDHWRQYLIGKASSLASDMGQIYSDVVQNLLLGLNAQGKEFWHAVVLELSKCNA